MTGRVDDIAGWLTEMSETSRRLDGSAVIGIDVETLAARIADLMDDWYDGAWPPSPPPPWRGLRTRVRVADRTPDATGVMAPWSPGDTIYELLEDGGVWQYRPEPFTVDGVDAVAYTVVDDQEEQS